MMFPYKVMFFLIKLIILFICISLNEAEEVDYIVGGVNAGEGELPYQVSIQVNKEPHCGGSIINHCWILTAAHCVVEYSKSQLSVLAGTTKLNKGGKRFAVEKYIAHEKYNLEESYTHDIAVIKLKKCLTYGKGIYRVKLESGFIGQGVAAIVSGWGYTDEEGQKTTNDLKKLQVTTTNNKACEDSIRLDIPAGDICTVNTEGRGFCQGDSGGPLVGINADAQIGIVSANIPCARGLSDIYTRISTYYEWIKNHIK